MESSENKKDLSGAGEYDAPDVSGKEPEDILASEKKTVAADINQPRKFDENFDIFDFVQKHDRKNTSIKKSKLPLVIMIVIITLCIAVIITLSVISSQTENDEVSDSRILGSWQREDGDIMTVTDDGKLTIGGETAEYTLKPDNVIELNLNGEIISAVYSIQDQFLFFMIPYDGETVTFEYIRAE